MQRSKAYRKADELVEAGRLYTPAEAVGLAKKTSTTKFDATVEVAGPSGRRTLPLTDLYNAEGDGIRRLRLDPGELVVAVDLPVPAASSRGRYKKLRVRPSFDFPELGVAVAGRWDADRVEHLRLAVGGVETYPRRFDELTDALVGGPLSDAKVARLAEEVTRRLRPVHNTFLQPDYRRRMIGVFVRRALAEAREARAG